MKKLHNELSDSVPLYREWHNKGYASMVHFLLLAIFCTMLSNSLSAQIYLSGELTANAINANSSANVLFTSKNTGRAADRILVKFKSGVSQSKRDLVLSQRKFHKKSSINSIGVDVLSIDPSSTPEEAIQNLLAQNNSDIEFAEVDKVAYPTFTPNDPSFSEQWDKTIVDTPTAWDTTQGSSTIIVGVSDTGVDCTHEDLAANCVPGWNIAQNNSDTTDTYGHGTAVAGIIAAVGNNGKGVAGTAWNVKIMPLRIDNPNDPNLPAGSAYMSVIANSITYAADNGVKVVNNSFGGYSSSLDTAAKYLASKTGGILIRSEGNSGADSGLPTDPNFLNIGATDNNDSLYSWSSFGQNVDLVAPGCGTTTASGGGYRSFCGTSNSSPEVAGLIALMYSVNPNLSAQAVTDALTSTAKDLGTPGWDATFGWGRIQADKAIQVVMGGSQTPPITPPPTTPPPTSDTTPPSTPQSLSASSVSTSQINLSWSASTDNTSVSGYNIFRNGTKISSTPSTSYSDTNLSPSTPYSYAVSAYDAVPNTSTQSSSVTATTKPLPDTTAPSIPQNVSATVISTTQINLSWSAATDNVAVTGYNIFRNGVKLTTTKTTSYSNTGLSANTTYKYTISAYDAVPNTSSQSSVVSATTKGVPLAISSFSVPKKTATTATITWVTNQASTGTLYYGTSTTNLSNSIVLSTSSTTHSTTVSGLTKKTKYYYQVVATNGTTTVKTSVSNFTTAVH